MEKQNHGLSEGFKVVDGVEGSSVLDVHEEGHPEDGEDEHDEEQEEADVEEGRHGHRQSKEQGSNPASALHQPKHSSDLGDSNDTEKRRRDEVLLDEVAQNDSCLKFEVKMVNKGRIKMVEGFFCGACCTYSNIFRKTE